jgi:catechol 2,3-dioxygenase-like lactoylglutathione lyase family enzyme
MLVLGLDHVLLAAPAGCEADARRFFGGLLGLQEIEKPSGLGERGGVWFRCGGDVQLHVGVDAEGTFAPARKAHPALRVAADGIDELALRLREGGVDVSWDDSLPGVRRFYASDPWGNRIELIAAPGA